ncbi:MAG: bacteriocin maturation protein [Cohnella sp.]|nr:bacteriocin maturation protein [Cohnella sp.]
MVKLQDDFVERYGSKILAVGAGSFLVSLVEALLGVGVLETKLNVLNLNDAAVMDWREKIQPFDWILYVSKQMNREEIRTIHTACREEKKNLLTATCIGNTGFAGPLVSPDSEGCWESAWRRLHHSAIRRDPIIPTISSAAEPMLANIVVFNMYRTITQATKPELANRLLLLDLHTLEASYYSFLPHPLVTDKGMMMEQINDLNRLLASDKGNQGDINHFLSFIDQLTSPQSGILQLWDEGDLSQLPLSQCRVQVVDPLSEGPAELLPIMMRAGLTHMEARKEAGLSGIEAYLTRMTSDRFEISAGATVEEAVYRGLQKCLMQQLARQMTDRMPNVLGVRLRDVQDMHCRYYLQALTTMRGAPTIGLGDDVHGFPVVWIGDGDHWYGCVGLNRTLALRMALQQALMKAQNRAETMTLQGVEISNLVQEEAATTHLDIEAVADTACVEWIYEAVSVLKCNRMRLLIHAMMAEPLLNEHLGGLFGVRLAKEEDQGE